MRIAVSAVLLATLLVADAALAAPPAHRAAPGAPVAAASVAKLSPADQKRVAAIEQYQHDLVSVVALRADPLYLLGAAILATPFKDAVPGLGFDALSTRAAAAPNASPAVEWARLGVCKDQADCPNAKAFAYLKQHAADNAAVWVVALDVAARDHDTQAEQAAFEHAAAAQTYDDYYGRALAGVAKATAVLPPLPDTTAGAHDGQPDNPEGVRALVAINAMGALPRPSLQPVVQLCAKAAVSAAAKRRKACLQLAHTLQWGSSPVARAVGLHIEGDLDPDGSAQAQQASHDLAWQVQQYSALLQHALTDPGIAARWLTAARTGGTELSLMLATLRGNGVPTAAPAGAAPASAASGAH
ncbi:MAG: hypothetical protein EPN38_00980 [Rhodanobacteraceae bacterium]|nr:MAG: hypothetical protein EPN38_00980 [Rhodanobacteraceae bacterium]